MGEEERRKLCPEALEGRKEGKAKEGGREVEESFQTREGKSTACEEEEVM